jgi:hypothetical protein
MQSLEERLEARRKRDDYEIRQANALKSGLPDELANAGGDTSNPNPEIDNGDAHRAKLDEYTVEQLDAYITERGGTPTGLKADKLALAKTLPLEAANAGGGWGNGAQ